MTPQFLAPRLPTDKLPENERDHARFIETLLQDMSRRCADFAAAVKLFDYSNDFLKDETNRFVNPQEYQLRWHWRGFAGREAAASVYRVWECIEYSGENLNKCRILSGMIDVESKREAARAFRRYFPGADGVRHGSQHYAWLYGTPAKFSEHAAGPLNYVNHIDGRTIQTIYRKKVVKLEVSDGNTDRLLEVRDLYWGAFIACGQ